MAYHTFHRWPKEEQEDVLQPAQKNQGWYVYIYIYTHTYISEKNYMQ